MHNRVLSWLFFCFFAAVASSFAQAPAPAVAGAAPGLPPPGFVLVAKVEGDVTKTINGQTTPLKINDQVEQTARVNTARASSIVLAFSNGATTQLGEDTELVIEQFLQDPFGATIQVANLDEEPSRSNTKLRLNRGELIGKVAKLKRDRGSTFVVETPVGAAGIRGTTFRIVFRPSGTGLAFFSISTVEGDVNFTPPGQGGNVPGAGNTTGTPADPNQPATPADPATPATPGTTTPGGTTPSGTTPATPATPGSGGAGVSVTGGQEVVITVTVTTAPTGQMVVAAPPTIVSTVPISTQTQTAIVQQAQQIAVAVATTSFSSPPPAPPPTPGGGTTTSTTTTPSGETASTTGTTGTTGSTGTTGTTGSTTGTTGTTGTTNTPPSGTTPATPATPANPGQTPATPATPAAPPVTTPPPAAQPPPRVTTGDGRPG